MRRLAGTAVVGLWLGAACGGEQVAGPPAVATVRITPLVDTLTALHDTVRLSAVALDAAGSSVPGKVFVWSSLNGGIATVDAASGLVTALGNGAATIQATVDGRTGLATLTVAQEVASVTVTPGTWLLAALTTTQQFSATARDANNNVVAGVPFLWLSSNQSVATVDTTGLARARGPGETTVTAAGRGVPGNALLTVTQTTAALAFTVQPTTTVAGEAISPAVEVEIRDASGQLVTSARDAITITLATNPGGGTLHGTATVNANGGIASFSGLWIDKATAGYTLAVAGASVPATPSAPFVISHAAAAALALQGAPHDEAAGVPLIVQVALFDRFGNPATDATNEVKVILASGPAGAQLFGTTTRTPTGGVAGFTDVNIHLAGAGYALRARSAGLDSVQSGSFGIVPAQAAQLHFLSFVTPLFANVLGAVDQFLRVEVRDAFGNLQPLPPSVVEVSIGVNPWQGPGGPGGTLTGTTLRTSAAAVAIFNDLLFDKPGAGYTVTASSPGLDGDATAPFQVALGGTNWLASGGAHTCIVNQSGVYCWGNNGAGQLGGPTGANARDSVPLQVHGVAIPTASNAISAGGSHTCVIVSQSAYCWGLNDHGQLGNGVIGGQSQTPVLVAGGVMFQSLSLGASHSCGVAVDNHAYCWGDNGNGQLGDSTHLDRSTPTPVYGNHSFIQVASGREHTCGTGGAFILCWGGNAFGQLGNGTLVPSDTPQVVVGGAALAVAAGDYHACAFQEVAPLDSIVCWGRNADGQLGNGQGGLDSGVPVRAIGISYDPFNPGAGAQLSAGAAHSCAFLSGASYCWGSNASGQLSDNTVVGGSDVPVPVQAAVPFDFLRAGGNHTCAFYYAGGPAKGVWCWGDNTFGQLGDGSTITRSSPAPIVQ